jgi:hypothetical protein
VDPAGNYFEINTSTIISDNTIHAGLTLSKYCGFLQPQKVIFDYQPDFNQFNMRIIDNQGKDVPYYGFHYPVNEHAKKIADPNYEVHPQLISKPTSDEEMYIPIDYAMQHMNLNPLIFEAQQNPELMPLLYPFEWFSDVSKAISKGKTVMVSYIICTFYILKVLIEYL